MKSVILAGGLGTRIRDVANNIPKPMVAIGQHPIIWHIMKTYAHFDVKDFIVCLGYMGDLIKDYFINYAYKQNDFTVNLANRNIFCYGESAENWNVTLVDTGHKSLTGCRVFRVKKYLEKDDIFMLTYGDGVGNVDLNKALDFHTTHGRILTVTGACPASRFGELEVDGCRVVSFNEKPLRGSSCVSAGFFICNKRIFDYLRDDENLALEGEPFYNLVKDREVMVFRHDGFWQPMDVSRDYQFLNALWNNGKAPWKVWA
ncbi:MAG: glucose-1-phosphate cytidylyltransferase [Holosporales bacterium]|jgi:glucose-1-phosphate cytidylyltransferase|nr:glucose-1-phosphate cytidylyltransferase [Holosporales bacterium]